MSMLIFLLGIDFEFDLQRQFNIGLNNHVDRILPLLWSQFRPVSEELSSLNIYWELINIRSNKFDYIVWRINVSDRTQCVVFHAHRKNVEINKQFLLLLLSKARLI